MVQVVPNRTEIEGTVVSRSTHPSLPDFDLLSVKVDKVAPVEGFSNLLADAQGTTVELAVRREALPAGPVDGEAVHGRAFVGGPGALFAEPLPDAASIVKET